MDPRTESVIVEIIEREGGAKETNIPGDAGGRTKYGISERANPDLWKDGPPTLEQAKDRFYQRYVVAPGFDKIADPKLQAQLVDFGVNSGPMIAIQKLQKILGVEQDYILGPKTLGAANLYPLAGNLNNQLVAERVKMLGSICVKNPSQLKFLNGWLSRALEFLS